VDGWLCSQGTDFTISSFDQVWAFYWDKVVSAAQRAIDAEKSAGSGATADGDDYVFARTPIEKSGIGLFLLRKAKQTIYIRISRRTEDPETCIMLSVDEERKADQIRTQPGAKL